MISFSITCSRQEKKEQEERERQKRLAEGEKESANHVRNLEAAQFDKILKENNLKIREVSFISFCKGNVCSNQMEYEIGHSHHSVT